MNITAENAGIGTTSPDNSALLDVSSTGKGLMLPRMSSAQRKANLPAGFYSEKVNYGSGKVKMVKIQKQ